MAVLKSAASMPAASNALLRDYASSRIRRGTLWVGLSVIACAIDLGLRLEPTGGIDVIRLIEDSLEGLGDDSGDPVIGLALIFSVTGFLQAIYAVRHSSRLRRLIQQGRPARRMLIQTGTVHTDDKNIDEPDEPYAAAYLTPFNVPGGSYLRFPVLKGQHELFADISTRESAEVLGDVMKRRPLLTVRRSNGLFILPKVEQGGPIRRPERPTLHDCKRNSFPHPLISQRKASNRSLFGLPTRCGKFLPQPPVASRPAGGTPCLLC
jgi:hypothetical protein